MPSEMSASVGDSFWPSATLRCSTDAMAQAMNTAMNASMKISKAPMQGSTTGM